MAGLRNSGLLSHISTMEKFSVCLGMDCVLKSQLIRLVAGNLRVVDPAEVSPDPDPTVEKN